MSYLQFLLVVALMFLLALWAAAQLTKRKIWILHRGFWGALIIFYALWWAGFALAMKRNFFAYDPDLLLGIDLGGIPVEEHFAGILLVFLLKGLFDLFEPKP